MTLQRLAPQDTTDPKRPTTVSRSLSTAFGRACEQYPSLKPEGHSVAAFVRWMRSQGHARVWIQEDLFMEYLVIQEAMRARPLPLKRFGRALTKAGCTPKQADWEKDGKRWRPMVVDLSAVDPDLAVIATNVSQISTSDTTAKRLPTSARPLPRLNLPFKEAA